MWLAKANWICSKVIANACEYCSDIPHGSDTIQVLVLTHEGATAEENIPYLSRVFWPAPLIALFGRCGACEPQVKMESAIYYG